jgi:hypothetical protein
MEHILTIAKSKGFHLQIVHKLKTEYYLEHKKQNSNSHNQNKKNGSPSLITVHTYTGLPIYLKILN